MSYRFTFIAALLVLLPASLTTSALGDEAVNISEQIDQLIRQLGSSSYTERQQAEVKLLKCNIEAFEPLIRAREHQDPEIASRARYLVNQIQVNLVMPDDSPAVAALMRNIFLLDRQKQNSRIAELSLLPDGEGLPALCRLIRFAESKTTAKTAAVGIIQSRLHSEKDLAQMKSKPLPNTGYPIVSYSRSVGRVIRNTNLFRNPNEVLGDAKPLGKPLGSKEREAIRQQLKSCHRPAAELVLAWFDFTEAKTEDQKKKAYDRWDKLCRQEEQLLVNAGATVNPAIFSFLLQLQIAKAIEFGLSEMTQVELIRRQLQQTYFWHQGHYNKIISRLLDEKVWKLADLSVPEFGSVMMRSYQQDILPRFFCLLIKTHQEHPEKSKLGDELFELYKKGFQPRGTVQVNFRQNGAVVLVQEGFYDRAISEHEEMRDIENVRIARVPERLLCWDSFQAMIDIYESLEQFESAAKTCDEMLKKQESLSDTQKKRPAMVSAMKKSKSHSLFYHAMAEKKKGNEAAYRKLLEEAIKLDPKSDQILIECYHLPVTPDYRDFHDWIIKQIQATVAEFNELGKKKHDREHYANRAAWLVAKTEGDLDSVIKFLEPVAFGYPRRNAAMLDTLALCYFKKGDLKKSVLLQRQAIEQLPHDPRIRKSWEMISEAYEKKTGKKPKPPKTGTARFRMMIGLPEKG